jgi:hypothetical protein
MFWGDSPPNFLVIPDNLLVRSPSKNIQIRKERASTTKVFSEGKPSRTFWLSTSDFGDWILLLATQDNFWWDQYYIVFTIKNEKN